MNIPGSFKCKCQDEFVGDGFNCQIEASVKILLREIKNESSLILSIQVFFLDFWLVISKSVFESEILVIALSMHSLSFCAEISFLIV